MSALQPEKHEWISIQPAALGWYVIEVQEDEKGYPVDAFRYPITQWAIEVESLAPYPVLLDGVRTDNPYILLPDGSIERPNIDGFANQAEWLADQQAAYNCKAGNDGR